MRVAVLGSSGQIGAYLTEHLSKEGLESTYEWYKESIGYEEPPQKLNPFSRFMRWMDQ